MAWAWYADAVTGGCAYSGAGPCLGSTCACVCACGCGTATGCCAASDACIAAEPVSAPQAGAGSRRGRPRRLSPIIGDVDLGADAAGAAADRATTARWAALTAGVPVADVMPPIRACMSAVYSIAAAAAALAAAATADAVDVNDELLAAAADAL